MERYTIELDGPVSILDYGGDGPLIVGVHGLEGSAYNWNLVAPTLVKTHRVIAPDLSGFGYTPPLEGGTTVERNAALVRDVIDYFGGEAMLIGNSMGGLVALLTAQQYPDRVNSLVLVAPAAPVVSWPQVNLPTAARLSVPLVPWVGKRLIEMYRNQISVDEGVAESLAFVAADSDALDETVWERAAEISALRRTQPWSSGALVSATNSIAPYVLRRGRFTKLIHGVTQPTLVIHGTEDRLVSVQAAKWISRERPDWTVVLFEGIGHVPMIEAPERVLEVFDAWESATLNQTADASTTIGSSNS